MTGNSLTPPVSGRHGALRWFAVWISTIRKAADALAEAFTIVVAQNERLASLQGMLMFQRSVVAARIAALEQGPAPVVAEW